MSKHQNILELPTRQQKFTAAAGELTLLRIIGQRLGQQHQATP